MSVTMLCPACKIGTLRGAGEFDECVNCGRRYSISSGIHDLRLDPALDTALDLESYDEHHNTTADNSNSLRAFSAYERAFRYNESGRTGRILEIGAGTGHLTMALARYGQFSEIHCSDISPRFMRRLEEKFELPARNRLYKYLFDANFIPFQDKTFEFVVGNSILHHLINFEDTIRAAYKVLRPGGIAIFGEPMIETSALVYLFAAQILSVDNMLPKSRLSPQMKHVLNRVAGWGELVMHNLETRDERAASMEDKFIFPTEYMREVARDIGFSGYQLMQSQGAVPDLATVIGRKFDRILGGTRVDLKEIEFFRPILQPMSSSYQKSMGRFLGNLFAINVFIK